MFVARGKIGPFRTRGEVIATPGGQLAVRLTLVDEGNGGRTVSAASAVYQPL